MPIDISGFTESLVKGIPHNSIYLSFNTRNIRSKSGKYVGQSEVHAKEINGACEAASWYYSLGEFDVQVTWFKNRPVRNIPYAWHPDNRGKILKFRQR